MKTKEPVEIEHLLMDNLADELVWQTVFLGFIVLPILAVCFPFRWLFNNLNSLLILKNEVIEEKW